MRPELLLALLATTVLGARGLSLQIGSQLEKKEGEKEGRAKQEDQLPDIYDEALLQEMGELKEEGRGENKEVEEEDKEASVEKKNQEPPKDGQQVIRKKHPGKPDDGSILVLDFEKSIAGVYDAEKKRCYLIGGVNPKMLNFSDGSQATYATSDAYEVIDNSLLPDAIKSECMKRPVDWMERTNLVAEEVGEPVKRGFKSRRAGRKAKRRARRNRRRERRRNRPPRRKCNFGGWSGAGSNCSGGNRGK